MAAGARPVPAKPRASRLGALAGVALFLVACGVQGPPEPPRLERPEAVKDLEVTQVGQTLEVSFTPPALATDGERLAKPLEIQILRAVSPAATPASGTEPGYQPWVTLEPTQWGASLRGSKVFFPLKLSEDEYRQWQGSALTVAVRTLTRGFRHRAIGSDLSKPVQVSLLNVSAPVEDLRGTFSEKAIELRWTPPAQSLGGRPLANLSAYRVYRRSAGDRADFTLRGETVEPEFLDKEFQFGHTYAYKVRALFKEGAQTAESEDSKATEVTPKDIFPPGAPSGLTAVFVAAAVELVWTANPEPDLAGYNVYRREGTGALRKLNPGLLRTPLFRDATVEPERAYTYQVTAVDLTGNEGPPSAEVSVETR